MTARRILSHLALAARHVVAANTYTDPEVRVGIARLAVVHLTDAVALISPAAGVRVAEAARRAFDDAHRRAVARDLDAHGLDEGGVASCAAEGTGGHVVDVVAGGADEEGLHGGEHGTDGGRWPARFSVGPMRNDSIPEAFCECEAPVVPAVWVDLRTMQALEDSVPVCSRCSRAVSQSGMVQ